MHPVQMSWISQNSLKAIVISIGQNFSNLQPMILLKDYSSGKIKKLFQKSILQDLTQYPGTMMDLLWVERQTLVTAFCKFSIMLLWWGVQ